MKSPARSTTSSAPNSWSATTRGLTATYNRFHDPYEDDPEIATLRELHAAMDRAVLYAYGWTDISTDCEFLIDYEIDKETWGARKKPYSYRWPNEVRSEVLARLLELNAQRASEEIRRGPRPPRHRALTVRSTSAHTRSLVLVPRSRDQVPCRTTLP